MSSFENVTINKANIGANLLKGGATESMLMSLAPSAARACGKSAVSMKVENHGDRIAVSVNCGKAAQ